MVHIQHVDKFNLMNAGFVGKAFCLLKQSLVSNTPLTDVFLPELGDSEHAANVNPSFQDTTTEIKDNSKKMRLPYIPSRIHSKAFRTGFFHRLFGELVQSAHDSSQEDNCVVSEECSTMLLEPKLQLHWQCESQILPVKEEGPKGIDIKSFYRTCCQRNIHRCPHFPYSLPFGSHTVNWINPKIRGGTSECGGGFVKGLKTAFMVTDGLDVKPMSVISGISILEKFDVPLSDVQERDVSVGEEEEYVADAIDIWFQALICGPWIPLFLQLGTCINVISFSWRLTNPVYLMNGAPPMFATQVLHMPLRFITAALSLLRASMSSKTVFSDVFCC
ncbi:hypothetical protein ACLOJK_011029 [Asimina triloba]